MKMISLDEFKETYTTILQEVMVSRESVVITQQKQPMVCISPYPLIPIEYDNPLKNSIVFENDIVAPMDDIWDVMA